MTTWLVSDTHINHPKVLAQRPYETLEEMNASIIKEWNDNVKPEDKVIHLGDFIFGDDLELLRNIVSQLNFSKLTLVIGNHDTPVKIKEYCKFDNISIASYIHDNEFLLSHYPVHTSTLEETSIRESGHHERYNIHGHLHGSCILDYRYLNINWDMCSSHFFDYDKIKESFLGQELWIG